MDIVTWSTGGQELRFPELSLGRRLLILVGVTLAPVVTVLVFNEGRLRASREREVHELALRQSQMASLEFQRILEGTQGILLTAGTAPVLQTMRMPDCAEYLETLAPQIPAFAWIAIVTPDGKPLCARGEAEALTRRLAGALPTDALEKAEASTGTYVRMEGDGWAVVPLAISIRTGATPEGRAVMIAALDLAWLGRALQQRDRVATSSLTVADRNGTILAREPFPERFVGTRIPESYLHLLTASKPGTLELSSQDGTRRIMGYHPLNTPPEGLYVSAGISRDEAFREISAASLRSLLIVLGSIALGVFGAWATGRTLVTGPVRRLLQTVQAWRRGNEDARTGMRAGAGELAQVGVAFDLFMNELAERRVAGNKAEQLRQVLVGELEHRVKNTLAMIQAIASQTFGRSGSVKADLETFSHRLKAIADAHQLLVAEHWKAAELHEIVEKAITTFSGDNRERITCAGPSIRIRSKAALTLSMALHELGTNAVKYGAFSVPTGRIDIEWHCDDGVPGNFRLSWRESGGPAVIPPKRQGFGTRMIERVLAAEFNARVQLAFNPEGFSCLIEADTADVVEGPDS